MTDDKRFRYSPFSRCIADDLTGFIYADMGKICELLNNMNEKKDRLAEECYEQKFFDVEELKLIRNILLETIEYGASLPKIKKSVELYDRIGKIIERKLEK